MRAPHRWGVAKAALGVTIQVLSCNGGGSISSVIAGMNEVLQLAQGHAGTPAVLVMSLGGSYSQAENNAVANLHSNGESSLQRPPALVVQSCCEMMMMRASASSARVALRQRPA